MDKILNNITSIWFHETKEPFEVKLYVSNQISKYIKRKPISPSQVIESIQEDGSLEIVAKISNKMEIFPIVKYWLPHMKILEPKILNEEIKKEISKILQ